MPEASLYAPKLREELKDETIYHMSGDELIQHVAREHCGACAHDIKRAARDLVDKMKNSHDITEDEVEGFIISTCQEITQNQISA